MEPVTWWHLAPGVQRLAGNWEAAEAEPETGLAVAIAQNDRAIERHCGACSELSSLSVGKRSATRLIETGSTNSRHAQNPMEGGRRAGRAAGAET